MKNVLFIMIEMQIFLIVTKLDFRINKIKKIRIINQTTETRMLLVR